MSKKTILLPLKRQFSIILITFFICTVFILLYGTYDYINLQTTILANSLQSYSAQMAKTTRQSYESYENICYSIAYNQAVQDYLKSAPSPDRYDQYRQLQSLLTNTANLNSYIIDIAVYGMDGTFASLCGSASTYEPFARNLPESRFPFQGTGAAMVNQVLCHILAMPVYTLGTGDSHYLGVMFLSVDIAALLDNNLSSENQLEPHMVFTDADSKLIFGEDFYYNHLIAAQDQGETFQDTLTKAFSSVEYSVTKYTITGIDHSLYVLIDKNQAAKQVVSITLRLGLGLGALIAVIFLMLLALYQPLILSINRLTQFMKNISAGDRRGIRDGAAIHQGYLGSIEIDEISKAFNDMLLTTDSLNHTIFDTYTRMYELENNNRRTEIAYLRSQVNPHFLYNTLTMICGMAAEGNTDKIITVTGALSQIFRYSIKGSDMVTLREEMEIVRSYLMIQEMRFENRFTISYEFSEDSYDCLIPRMVIQPLAENAIVHGLEKKIEPGNLIIGAGRNPQQGYLAIWIFDTGVGMSKEKLEELRAAITYFPKHSVESHESIGILNVNSRMVLYYGTNYTLILDSEENVGTNVQIRIPYHIREAEHQPGKEMA